MAFLCDVQVGMWLGNEGTTRRMVARLVERPPAAVLLGGDVVYHAASDPAPKIATAVGIVRPLVAAGIPT